ncbi:hypothetical protein ACFXPN_32145 [Streptomyces griseorubiginosus]|uniref:hypothetical protein n=1 Tax=Streptomyces griseorubiginosus TaxID=67304 RepID=UPI0036ACB164
MEQSGASTRLAGAVQGLMSELVSALRSGDRFRLAGLVEVGNGPEVTADPALAAVRVVGADVVLPSVLLRCAPPGPDDLTVLGKAVHAYPPPAGAPPTSVWSHWAMRRALSRLDAGLDGRPDDGTEPGAEWLEDAPWQFLTHQLAVLAPLALPGEDCAVARVARGRPVDVARGFVRAVRRRDWLQAAGAGRWLVLLDGVPHTLGLDAGLEFVAQMGGEDARVAFQVQAARLMRTGVLV